MIGWPVRKSSQQMLQEPLGISNLIMGMVRCRGMAVNACARALDVEGSERGVKLPSSSLSLVVVVSGCGCGVVSGRGCRSV